MKLSHSRVECFKQCPYKFKLRYIDKLQTYPKGDPQDPLVLGHALHTGIEKDVKSAIKEYYAAYPVITDAHITEAIKLEYWIPRVKAVLPKGQHEVKLETNNFVGYIDLVAPAINKMYDLFDFKYSNNVKNYLNSDQLHLYKYYFEKLNKGKEIYKMQFVFIPKCALKLKYKNKTNKRDETLDEFRRRVKADLDSKEIQFIEIPYDENKVFEFLKEGKSAENCVDYIKQPTRLCDWCEYQRYCESDGKDDLDIMQLPSTERRKIEANNFKKIWFYGLPFVGKTYLANKFETPLMLNTDGNFKQVDAPVIRIVDVVTQEGRMTKRKYAWEVFQETVDELEKQNNDFKTIIVDLLEDVYDACRIKVCVDNGWDHESDDSFKAYDIVRSEFLRTMKRLLNLNYNIVLISHEDTSRDITKKTGDKITAVKPNLADKVALKIAGMVDICCRIKNDEGKRTINFKSNEVEFGGGRLTINVKEIPCEYDELMKIYESQSVRPSTNIIENITLKEKKLVEIKPVETTVVEPEKLETPEVKTRTRKPREVVEEVKQADEVVIESDDLPFPEEKHEEKPQVESEVPRRRRRRAE